VKGRKTGGFPLGEPRWEARAWRAGKPTLLVCALTALVFLSRLPFLGAGYGNDPDAWSMANAAGHIARTGEYMASRLPGYPLPELTYALMTRLGLAEPEFFNGMTALLSAVGSLLFVYILKAHGSRDAALGGLALAFTPVYFINSTNSMDYVWGLTLVLAGTACILRDQIPAAAVCLGLAIGCRLTSGAMLLPLSVLIIWRRGRAKPAAILGFCALACAVGALFYVPAVSRYGLRFLGFSGNYPPLLWLVYGASLATWGAIGSAAFGVAIAWRLAARKASPGLPPLKGRGEVGAERLLIATWVLVILLYLVAFVRLPHDGAYLIPIIPFVLLLAHRFLPRPGFALLCVAIILSSFVLTIERGKVTLAGPVLNDHRERLQKTEYVVKTLRAADGLDQKSLILAGPWLPQIEATRPAVYDDQVRFVWLAGKAELESYLQEGYTVYYLADQRELTQEYEGYDPDEMGARPLIPGGAPGVKW
jgi:hypothetical protein